jgi:ribosomal protein S11
MTSRMTKALRAGAAAFAIAVSAPILALPLSVSAYAQTQDVLLENINMGPVKIGKIEMKGTNATQDQIQSLVSGQMPPPDMQALLKGLTAESIAIEGVEIAPPEGGSMSVPGISVEELAVGEGKMGSLTVAGLTAKDIGTPTGKVNMQLGEFKVEGLEAPGLIEALENGSPEKLLEDPSKMPKFDSVSLGASEMSGPMEGAQAPNNIINVKMAEASMTLGDFIGRVATKAEYAFKNVAVKFPEGSEPATQLKAIGYDEVDLSISGKGSWNKDAKTYSIEDMVFEMANGAKLSLSANLGNVDETFFAGDPQTSMMAMLSAGISDAEISLENNGLVEKGLAFAAQQQGKTAEQLQQEAQGMATVMLPAILGTEPGAQALAKALAEFAAAPKNITVSAKAKSGMLTAQDFAAVATPADVFTKIDLEATANK